MNHRVLIQDSIGDGWLAFNRPVAILTATKVADVAPVLRRVQRAVREQQLYAAGFLTYEAAGGLDQALQTDDATDLPLLWFGLYEKPIRFSNLPPAADPAFNVGTWQPRTERRTYLRHIQAIKQAIARGDTYQVNYTFQLETSFTGEPQALFDALVAAQEPQFAAFVDTGRFAICSASPELFFTRVDGKMTARPMKGTVARGMTLAEDEAQATWLQESEKNQAENVMIVDMLRNDLGRVATSGSVQVPALFDVERYPTLWQMTSTVTANYDGDLLEIMTALFPCASITGAPKVRTMEIIRALEQAPRGIYTGSIGYLAPDGTMQFNVAIRTVTVDREARRAHYGVGGGIVWDSDAAEEYDEALLKAQVLTTHRPTFDLLETMLWEPDDGIFLREYHMRRLHEAGIYFNRPVPQAEIDAFLDNLLPTLPPVPHKLRLLVGPHGFSLTHTPHQPGGPVRLTLAPLSVNTRNPFLYHKTTERTVYNQARAGLGPDEDAILYNEQGELTETNGWERGREARWGVGDAAGDGWPAQRHDASSVARRWRDCRTDVDGGRFGAC